MQLAEKISAWLKKQYSLDLRSLALMRIGIGIILIADLLIRANSLTAHYTNAGVMPLSELPNYTEGFHLSFHTMHGGAALQVFLFSIAFIFAAFVALGYKTRLATFISWLLLCSLQARNPLIGQGGDDLLRLVLFWGIFLPWGKRFSADHLQSTEGKTANAYVDIPALGFALLIFSAYFFSSLLKTSSEWHEEGTALYYALSLDQLVLPLGKIIYPHPALLHFLTHLVYYTELIAPCVLFIPFFNPFFRTLGIAGIIILHVGISLTLFVGLFFLVGIITAIGLLPSAVMDRLERRFRFLINPVIRWTSSIFRKKNPGTPAGFMQFLKTNFYLRLVLNSALLFFIAYCLLWNISGIKGTGLSVSPGFRWLGGTFRFEQCWNMFSPAVLKEDGWFVMEGITAASDRIDINRDGATADYSKPECILDYIEDDRWRKFGEGIIREENAGPRMHYCRYLLAKWNREHRGKQVISLNLVYMRETSEPGYKHVEPTRDVLCTCNRDSLN